MQAIIYRSYGPPDVLEYEELDRPIPAPGEVPIRFAPRQPIPAFRATPSFIRRLPDRLQNRST
jgi:hypothetical protein